MKPTRFLAGMLALFTLATACNTSSQREEAAADTTVTSPMPTGDNSRTSLDWAGTYNGVVPCADCEGIETSLTINSDMTYSLSTKYLGTQDTGRTVTGSFTWNDAGSTITLGNITDAPSQYFVGENTLTQLDMTGQRITGELAPKYVLIKAQPAASAAPAAGATAAPVAAANEVAVSIADKKWKIVEIMGKAVSSPDAAKPYYIEFRGADKRVSAWAGCNNFMGSYELPAETRIKFSKMARTQKACPDMSIEDQLAKALETVDNYSMQGNRLSLNRARMAPLVRLEAI